MNRYAAALDAVIPGPSKACRAQELRPPLPTHERTRAVPVDERSRRLAACQASRWPKLYLLVLMRGQLTRASVTAPGCPGAMARSIFESTRVPGIALDVKEHWQRALKQAHMRNFRFHELRHKAAPMKRVCDDDFASRKPANRGLSGVVLPINIAGRVTVKIFGDKPMKNLGAFLACAIISLTCQGAFATEIKVLSAMGMKSVLEAVKPDFEATSGDRLVIAYDTAGLVRKRVEDGERPDVVFVQKTWLDNLKNKRELVDSSIVDLAYSAVGLVGKTGTPKQDISSKDKLIRVLQEAHSIGYTDPKAGGLSGSHFAKLVKDFGIEDEVRQKSVLGKPMARVTSGEVEYAVLQLSEIVTLKGVVFMGPFPDEVQEKTPTSAAVLRSSRESEKANAFLKYMQGPAVKAVFRAKGMTPAQ